MRLLERLVASGYDFSHARTAIRRAKLERYEARMLPGISSAECLFADLGIDSRLAWARDVHRSTATAFATDPRARVAN